MKRFIATAIALVAVTILFDSNVLAQHYGHGQTNINARRANAFGQGYSFGRGRGAIGFNGIGLGNYISAFRNTVRPERQPFFAVNPPVYYSGIVKRPYGISPFPAPAGTMPVEMKIPQAQPVTIANPFFKDAMPASETTIESPKVDETDNKTTLITNPYFDVEVAQPTVFEGNVGFASLESVIEEN